MLRAKLTPQAQKKLSQLRKCQPKCRLLRRLSARLLLKQLKQRALPLKQQQMNLPKKSPRKQCQNKMKPCKKRLQSRVSQRTALPLCAQRLLQSVQPSFEEQSPEQDQHLSVTIIVATTLEALFPHLLLDVRLHVTAVTQDLIGGLINVVNTVAITEVSQRAVVHAQ